MVEEQLNLEILETLGKLTRKTRKEVVKIPKEGVKISKIINFVEEIIFSKGYLPAFPCTVCVNDVAAHYTIFEEDYILKKGDVIKIDFGISHNGFITDNAVTVEIEDNKYKRQMDANLEGLNATMEKAEIGVEMSKLGKTVNDVAKKYNFNTIHNLCGHQIARNNLHCGLSVPNFENEDKRLIEENMELAIEPFFTSGQPKIKSSGPSNIIHLISSKPIRDPIAKKVLDYIKEFYPHLPFSKRWLVKEVIEQISPENDRTRKAFDLRRVRYAIKLLKQNGNLYEYDALSTIDGEIVTQYEDSVVFVNKKKRIITRL